MTAASSPTEAPPRAASGGDELCRECRNPIPIGARKCSKCSSFQDWRRPIFAWSGLFTALLALLPLWAGAYSLWNLAVQQPARIEALPVTCRSDKLVVYARNTGQREAILGDPTVEILQGRSWRQFDYSYTLADDKRVAVPGKGSFIDLSPPEGGSFPPNEARSCGLRAALPILGSDKPKQKVVVTCDCTA